MTVVYEIVTNGHIDEVSAFDLVAGPIIVFLFSVLPLTMGGALGGKVFWFLARRRPLSVPLGLTVGAGFGFLCGTVIYMFSSIAISSRYGDLSGTDWAAGFRDVVVPAVVAGLWYGWRMTKYLEAVRK